MTSELRPTPNRDGDDDPAGMLASLNDTVPLHSASNEDWFSQIDTRFVALTGLTNTSSPSLDRPRANRSSSMARTLLHQNQELSRPPSLTHSYVHTNAEDTATESSISTGLASRLTGLQILEDNNGVLERPQAYGRAPYYQCVFPFLDCEHLSADDEEWYEHSLSHFRGEDPPTSVLCPLCSWTAEHDNGMTSWRSRMEHLVSSHLTRGESLKHSRPDFGLFQHLWRKRLIDDQDLKELMGGNHNLAHQPRNFVSTNGRDRRHERGRTLRQVQHVPARALHVT